MGSTENLIEMRILGSTNPDHWERNISLVEIDGRQFEIPDEYLRMGMDGLHPGFQVWWDRVKEQLDTTLPLSDGVL